MYSLYQTPVLLAFIKNLLAHEGYKYSNSQIEKHLLLVDKCNCHQRDCATITLKCRKRVNLFENVDYLHTSKGYVVIHQLENGFIELEAIAYRFPHKEEIDKLFRTHYRSNIVPRAFPTAKSMINRDNTKLARYFHKGVSLYEQKILGRLDA